MKLSNGMNGKNIRWKVLCTIVIVICILGFTPLVIPYGRYQPMFLGIPYTLWVGILINILFVLLIIFGSKVHPGGKDDPE